MTNASDSALSAPDIADVTTVVRDYVADELKLDPGTIDAGSVLKELPGADSVRLLRVVAQLERHYDAEFDDDDIFRARTVGDLAALVARQRGGA